MALVSRASSSCQVTLPSDFISRGTRPRLRAAVISRVRSSSGVGMGVAVALGVGFVVGLGTGLT